MANIEQILATNAWVAMLPAEVAAELASHAQLRTLRDGELLYARGDEANGLFGVVSGGVRISATSAEGKEATVTLIGPGEWLGEISIFDGLPRISDAFAAGATELVFIPRAAFQQLLARRPELYEPFVKILCQKLRLSLAFLADMVFLPLSGRLARRLLDLARDYGEDSEHGRRITLRLPQDELGRMMGVSRQSISKELKAWEAKGLIRIAYGEITLCDEDGLRQLLE